jgi:hypothetical protein
MTKKPSDESLRSLVNGVRVETPDFEKGMESISQWMAATRAGVPVTALILGESGTGKTELVETFVAKHVEKRDASGLSRRALRMQIPTSPTAIAILECMLRKLGDPRPEKGTRNNKMHRVIRALTDQSVLMIFLDDLQHCLDKNSGLVIYDASECLKELIDNLCISIVGVGLHDARKVVASNEQFARRNRAPVKIRRFDWADAESQDAFVALLAAFQSQLSMFDMPQLDDPDFALRMYLASGGIIDFVAKVLSQVVWDLLDGNGRVARLSDFNKAWTRALFDADGLGENPFGAHFRLDCGLEEKVRKAKLINQHIIPPVSKHRTKAANLLASVGL